MKKKVPSYGGDLGVGLLIILAYFYYIKQKNIYEKYTGFE
jgi:hypothetical protein